MSAREVAPNRASGGGLSRTLQAPSFWIPPAHRKSQHLVSQFPAIFPFLYSLSFLLSIFYPTQHKPTSYLSTITRQQTSFKPFNLPKVKAHKPVPSTVFASHLTQLSESCCGASHFTSFRHWAIGTLPASTQTPSHLSLLLRVALPLAPHRLLAADKAAVGHHCFEFKAKAETQDPQDKPTRNNRLFNFNFNFNSISPQLQLQLQLLQQVKSMGCCCGPHSLTK